MECQEVKEVRTPKQTATAVANSVSEINLIFDAVRLMEGFKFFSPVKYKNGGKDTFIAYTCAKHNVDDTHIRTVLRLKDEQESML